VTTAETLPIVATEGTLLTHIPPTGALDRAIVEPVQTVDGPVIGIGVVTTLTVICEEQDVPGKEYTIFVEPKL